MIAEAHWDAGPLGGSTASGSGGSTKQIRRCDLSQNGFVEDAPHRQRAIERPASGTQGLPSGSRITTWSASSRPIRYGPLRLSRMVMLMRPKVGSGCGVLNDGFRTLDGRPTDSDCSAGSFDNTSINRLVNSPWRNHRQRLRKSWIPPNVCLRRGDLLQLRSNSSRQNPSRTRHLFTIITT